MGTIRIVILLLGLALMLISLLPVPWPERIGNTFVYRLGLLLVVGAAFWPDNLH